MSAWGAVPFLHRLLGVIQSKNSRALCWAVWGIAFGLSAAAATKSNMLFGKVLGWGFVLPALLQIVSPGTSSACPSFYPGRRRRKKGIKGGAVRQILTLSPTPARGTCTSPGPRCAVALTSASLRTCTPPTSGVKIPNSFVQNTQVIGANLGCVAGDFNFSKHIFNCHKSVFIFLNTVFFYRKTKSPLKP